MAIRRTTRRGGPRDEHERRFVELLAFAAPDARWTQELSLPRKARRLDVVYCFDEAPVWFGALQDVCHQRMVLLEHVSRAARPDDLSGAWLGLAWLHWQRDRSSRAGASAPWGDWDAHGVRPPLAIVVADGARGVFDGAIPSLRAGAAHGAWSTHAVDEGGVIVVDTRRVRASEGYAWWSWLGRPPSEAVGAARLERLIDDTTIPIVERERRKEAAMHKTIPVSEAEGETVYQRLKREAHEGRLEGRNEGRLEGRNEGRLEGRNEGRLEGRNEGREALLRIAARIAAHEVPALRAIENLDELEDAVAALLTRTVGD